MPTITVIEKSESLSWDDIHECLWQSHAQNRNNGMMMKTSLLSGEELKSRIKKNSISYKTFVAFDGGKLVGTATVAIRTNGSWYAKGRVAYLMLAGILPDYSGLGIYRSFFQMREQYGKDNGCKILLMDTAEHNYRVQTALLKNGFDYVDFFATQSKHYSVAMAKWYGECPYPSIYLKFRFILKKCYIKIRFKPGKIKRFI